MKRTFGWRSIGALAATTVLWIGVRKDADACGACFSGQSESTIVNDHRMALSISQERTILWDQISYSGNPSEFAYVVPAKRGTRLEASKEIWFGALDAATRPIIMSPQGGYPGGGGGGGGGYYPGNGSRGGDGTTTYYGTGEGGGCCSGASDSAFGSADAPRSSGEGDFSGGNSPPSGGSGSQAPPPIQIVDQAVVGAYQTVTLRTTDPKALQKWLTRNGFAIPEIAGPIIEEYVKLGLDFIALRLRPGKDVRSMEPIRIVSPGMDLTLPMRLMQIGSGAKVGV